jgi:hypothetical protein
VEQTRTQFQAPKIRRVFDSQHSALIHQISTKASPLPIQHILIYTQHGLIYECPLRNRDRINLVTRQISMGYCANGSMVNPWMARVTWSSGDTLSGGYGVLCPTMVVLASPQGGIIITRELKIPLYCPTQKECNNRFIM